MVLLDATYSSEETNIAIGIALCAGKDRLEAVTGLYREWRIFSENGIKNAVVLGGDGQQTGLINVDVSFDHDCVKTVCVTTADLF